MRKLIKKYAGSYTDRVIALTAFSVIVNLISASVKLVIGIDLHSFWYIVNAIYYLTLVAARIASVYTYQRIRNTKSIKKKVRIESLFYRRSGLFIFLIAAVYFFLCVYMFTQQYAVVAEGYGVIMVLFIVVYKFIFSVYGLYMTRKMRDRISETIKTVSFTDAGISLIIAICTVLNFVDENIAVKTSAALGMLISASFMVTGMVMIVARTRKYHKSIKANSEKSPEALNENDSAD